MVGLMAGLDPELTTGVDSGRRASGRRDPSRRSSSLRDSNPAARGAERMEIQSDTTWKSIHWRDVKNGGGGEAKKPLWLLEQQEQALLDARKGSLAPGTELHIALYKQKIKSISDLVTRSRCGCS